MSMQLSVSIECRGDDRRKVAALNSLLRRSTGGKVPISIDLGDDVAKGRRVGELLAKCVRGLVELSTGDGAAAAAAPTKAKAARPPRRKGGK